jgi:hypothetical protein
MGTELRLPAVVTEWFALKAVANSGDLHAVHVNLDPLAAIMGLLKGKKKIVNRSIQNGPDASANDVPLGIWQLGQVSLQSLKRRSLPLGLRHHLKIIEALVSQVAHDEGPKLIELFSPGHTCLLQCGGQFSLI